VHAVFGHLRLGYADESHIRPTPAGRLDVRALWRGVVIHVRTKRSGPEASQDRTDDVVLRVADSTDDVGAVPGFSLPPNGRVLVKPEVVVTRELAL